MDINNIASLATTMAGQRTGGAIGVSVLKKALEIQTGGAMALTQRRAAAALQFAAQSREQRQHHGLAKPS